MIDTTGASMDRDAISLVVEFTKDGRRYQYRNDLDPRALAPLDDSSSPFAVPNRHNLRIRLNAVRRHVELDAAGKAFDAFGSLFGIVFGPRMIQTRGGLTPDHGDALEMLICPPTMAEGFVEGLANAARRRDTPGDTS